MTFKDKFPFDFEFEIDRPKLQRYYRTVAMAVCSLPCLFFSILLTLASWQNFLLTHPTPGFYFRASWLAVYLVVGIGIGQLLASIFYFVGFRPASKLAVNNQRLLVEGPFLRVITGSYFVFDRKIHFRDIHTYTTMQGPLQRWFGLKTFTFKTGSWPGPSGIMFEGLIDPDEVRDRLSLIDASRENAD